MENGILTYEQTFSKTNVPETDVLLMADIPGAAHGHAGIKNDKREKLRRCAGFLSGYLCLSSPDIL